MADANQALASQPEVMRHGGLGARRQGEGRGEMTLQGCPRPEFWGLFFMRLTGSQTSALLPRHPGVLVLGTEGRGVGECRAGDDPW